MKLIHLVAGGGDLEKPCRSLVSSSDCSHLSWRSCTPLALRWQFGSVSTASNFLRAERGLTPSCMGVCSPRHYRECSLPRHQFLSVALLPQRRAGLPPGRSFFGHMVSATFQTDSLLHTSPSGMLPCLHGCRWCGRRIAGVGDPQDRQHRVADGVAVSLG